MGEGNKVSVIKNNKVLLSLWILVFAFAVLCIVLPIFNVFAKIQYLNFTSFFLQTRFVSILKNTFLLCLLSSTFATLFGYLYAYALQYTNIRFKNFFKLVPLLHLILPPSVNSLSFILLLGKNGFITKEILNLDISLYGLVGLVVSQVMSFFPIVYIICLGRLRSINHTLELASKSMGKSDYQIFLLTFRLCFSSILQSFLLVSVLVLSDFGNPMVLSGRFRVLALEIYSFLTGWIDVNTASFYAIVLIIPSLVLFSVQQKFERANIKRASLNVETTDLNCDIIKSKGIISVSKFICYFLSLYIFLQIICIFSGALQNVWSVDSSFTIKHIKNIKNAFFELGNSIYFSFIASLVSVIISVLSAYLINRSNLPFRRPVELVLQLPCAMPGTFVGLAFVITSALLNIYNSKLLIILAISIGFLPYSYKIISSRLNLVSSSLDDASCSCGISRFGTFMRIILPLTSQSIIWAFIYNFIRGIGTMSAVIFLVSFDTPLVSIKILNLIEQGFWGDAAALTSFLMLIIFGISFLALALFKKRRLVW